jgi:hypothetical protein
VKGLAPARIVLDYSPEMIPSAVFTIGHSTRPIEDFIHLLKSHGVLHLVDVRTMPRSRFNPQFDIANLPELLRAANIHYTHLPGLGGLRRPRPDSINRGWRNQSFRGYADYMQTAEFKQTLQRCLELAAAEPVALMCAEAVPWRCHRSLIADALVARGIDALEIASETRVRPHTLTPFARVDGVEVTYPTPAAAGDDRHARLPFDDSTDAVDAANPREQRSPERQVAPDRWRRASR